uniref:Uncharacterized protein n=1 Tax=Avena sativa TaxID=4498 RepID=A0ACD5VEQ9_AVESA
MPGFVQTEPPLVENCTTVLAFESCQRSKAATVSLSLDPSISLSSEECELVPLESMVASDVCPKMYLSYGTATLAGRSPVLADGVTAVPSFTTMSPPMGMDYFGVYDGSFGAYSAKHLEERLHVAVAMGIDDELVDKHPRFLQFPGDLEGWWRKTVIDAFRRVDDEMVARLSGGMAVGCPAVLTLVLKDYLVLASRGATCKAVIYRGQEAVHQLTPGRRPEPYKQTEQQDLQEAGGDVVKSTGNLEDNMDTSSAILFRPYLPKPEVVIVERKPRDKFLILATGGLWNYISPSQACSFIQNRLRTSRIIMPWETALDDVGSPTILAEELAKLAVRRGSQGNVTVTVILFKNFWDEHCP